MLRQKLVFVSVHKKKAPSMPCMVRLFFVKHPLKEKAELSEA